LQKPVRGLTERAVERLLGYSWPGNVRQLRSALRRAALLADEVIDDQHLSLPTDPHAQQDGSPVVLGGPDDCVPLKQRIRSTVMIAEQSALRKALTAADGNKAKAARMLRIDYKTLHTKLKTYGIGRLGGENVKKNR
jgi:two-component system nitrogen regulation response regulator GlnG